MPSTPVRNRPARGRLPALLACAALAVLSPSGTLAQSSLDWPDDARRAGTAEYVAAGTLTLSAYLLGLYRPSQYRTTGPWLFDRGARDLLRLRSQDARIAADVVSDVLLWAVVTYPVADALLAATTLRADQRVPVEIAAQTALVLSASATLTYLAKALVARERPVSSVCRAYALYSPECGDDVPALSFWSGHAAASFAAATMACVHHRQLNLYGHERADAVACAVPLGVAAGLSLLRIMADQHYASDVLMGAAVGVLSGLGLGLLLHY